MRGSNTLILTEATLVEAMQEYLDKRYTPHVVVSAVKTNASPADTFTVDVTEKPAS